MRNSWFSGILAWVPLGAVVIMIIGVGAVASDRSSLVRHVVIEAATEDTPRSDTASVAELGDGRLMVVYHKYEKGQHGGHDQGMCRIWSKISRDGGRSWGEGRMLVDAASGDMAAVELSAGA
ncbi:MAG: hypothetical protein ACYSW3_09395 [Planctomycetota bacterium]|jgi:hypothetical protein